MLCSPGDTAPERKALEKAVREWTDDNLFKEEIVLLPVGWESLPPLTDGQNGQVRINESITSKADIFIGVFKHRFGQAGTGDDAATVEELLIGMKKALPVHVWFYDGDEGINQRDLGQLEQLGKVHEFKARIAKQGLYGSYVTVEDLVAKLNKVLNVDSHEYLKANRSPKPFPTAGSTKVYTTQTAVNDNGVNQAPASASRPAGLPTKPPAKTVKNGLPTRPQSPQNSPVVELQPVSNSPLPKRPQRPDSLPPRTAVFQSGNLASTKSGDGYASMAPSKLVDATERKRALERQMKLYPEGLHGDVPLPDIDDRLFPRGHSDDQISRNEKLSKQKEQDSKNAESVARWNANKPLISATEKARLDFELPRIESWQIEGEHRDSHGRLTGFILLQTQKENADDIKIHPYFGDGSRIAYEYRILAGNDSSQPIKIAVTFPKPLNEKTILVRVTWDLTKDGKYPKETHLVVGGDSKQEKKRAIDDRPREHDFRQGWSVELEKDIHGYPTSVVLANELDRIARNISVRFIKSNGTKLPSNLQEAIEAALPWEAHTIKFDPNTLDGQAVTMIVEWYEKGLQRGTKIDLGPLAGYRTALIKPVIAFVHRSLRVTFEGDPSKIVDDLQISVRGVSGEELDIGFPPKGYSRLGTNDELKFPVELSSANSMHNFIDMTWSVDGHQFTSKQRIHML